jgi:hypothetical protein
MKLYFLFIVLLFGMNVSVASNEKADNMRVSTCAVSGRETGFLKTYTGSGLTPQIAKSAALNICKQRGAFNCTLMKCY